MAKLTDKQQRFINEYLIDLNATQAAIRAGYSQKTADKIGAQLLGKTSIAAAIMAAQQERANRTEITADRVLEEIWNVVTVDANEIVELRRTCCRYCWGKDNKYQYTAGEMEEAKKAHKRAELEAAVDGKRMPPFNEAGGIGYNARRDPNPDCNECFGEGIIKPHFNDTRKLSRAAKSLYAGIKTTRDGIEVKMHSKDKMVELLGRHLGMFKDKLEIEVTGNIADRLKRARERVANAADE